MQQGMEQLAERDADQQLARLSAAQALNLLEKLEQCGDCRKAIASQYEAMSRSPAEIDNPGAESDDHAPKLPATAPRRRPEINGKLAQTASA